MSIHYNPIEDIFEVDSSTTISNESRITDLENLTFKIAYYAEITTTSGQISKPQGSTILLNQWSNGVDAVLSGIPGGTGTFPDFQDTGVDVTSFDLAGNYTLSGALPTNPTALIYYFSIALKDYPNLDLTKTIEYAELSLSAILDHSLATNRDVAGNHTKLIPLVDSEEAIQILANDNTELLNVNSIDKSIDVNTDLMIYKKVLLSNFAAVGYDTGNYYLLNDDFTLNSTIPLLGRYNSAGTWYFGAKAMPREIKYFGNYVYLVDIGYNRQIILLNKNDLSFYARLDINITVPSQLEGIAVDSNYIYVTARNEKIYRFTRSGTVITYVDFIDISAHTNNNFVINIEVGLDGNLYIIDNSIGVITKLTTAGVFIENITIAHFSGVGANEYSLTQLADGRWIVSDILSGGFNKISVYNPDFTVFAHYNNPTTDTVISGVSGTSTDLTKLGVHLTYNDTNDLLNIDKKVNIDAGILTGNIQFDITDITTFVPGLLRWNDTEKTLGFGVEGGDIDINKELFDYYVDIDNNLVEGNIVSVVGISGNRQAVRKTDVSNDISATACVGMVTHKNIDGTVRVTKKGRVRSLNTAGMTEGLPIYVDFNTPGAYTQSIPQAPYYFIHVGIVEVRSTNNGVIDVDIQISPKLTMLSDVNGTPLTQTGQMLVWNDPLKVFDFTENISNYQKKIIPNNTDIASSSNAGSFRYYVSGNNSYVDMCMQTGASTYEWINIVQNNW